MSAEQEKKASQVISDAAVKDATPTTPTVLSDEDLEKVAGGTTTAPAAPKKPAAPAVNLSWETHEIKV
jgi:hypothetical protein